MVNYLKTEHISKRYCMVTGGNKLKKNGVYIMQYCCNEFPEVILEIPDKICHC